MAFQTISERFLLNKLLLAFFLFTRGLQVVCVLREGGRLCPSTIHGVTSVIHIILVVVLTEVKEWLDVQLETFISIAEICPDLTLGGALTFLLLCDRLVLRVKNLAEA